MKPHIENKIQCEVIFIMKAEQLVSSIIYQMNEQIKSEKFKEAYRSGSAFTRKGKLSFSSMVYYTLQAVPKSILSNYAKLRDAFTPLKLPLVSKQAISKARQGISYKAFEALYKKSVEIYYKCNRNLRMWNGYHIYAIDGSTLQIPETKENIEYFGGNPNKTGKLMPLASVSLLYDIMNDMLIDGSLNEYRYNERKSAMEHMQFLPNLTNAITLFDRGYPSEELFRYLDSKGILFLMRLPKHFKKLIFFESDTLFMYPSNHHHGGLTLRCINFTLENGVKEYLVTNVMENRLCASDFADLYCLRWGIEGKYRELKNRFEIENWCSMKPITIKQEFFAALLISNIVSILKKGSDSALSLRLNTRHIYQANRSYILSRVKHNIIALLFAPKAVCEDFLFSLLDEAVHNLSIVRPDRRFGRFRTNDRRKFYTHLKSCL